MPCRSTRPSICSFPFDSLSSVGRSRAWLTCWRFGAGGAGAGADVERRRVRLSFLRSAGLGGSSSTGFRALQGLGGSGDQVPQDAVLVAERLAGARLIGCALDKRPRQQRVEIGRAAHDAGDLAGGVSRAGEQIAARRSRRSPSRYPARSSAAGTVSPPKAVSDGRVDDRRACRMCAAGGRPPSTCPGVSGTLAAATGPSAGSSTAASRKKM